MPMECPRCGEIEFAKFNTCANGMLDEWECENCKLYETTINPDYDPTPEAGEEGEPPTTLGELMGDPR